MSVSIVMPVYNEEAIIEATVRLYYDEIVRQIPDTELIVVDDASTDKTATIILHLQQLLPGVRIVTLTRNLGHGRALRRGYEEAHGDYVFQVDSDNQFDPHDFWKLYSEREHFDLILGFRAKRQDSRTRRLLSAGVGIFNHLLFGVRLRDANCPYRLMKTEFVQSSLELIDEKALAPNIMISLLAAKTGLLEEVPVNHQPRRTGKNSLRAGRLLGFSFKALAQLVFFRLTSFRQAAQMDKSTG
jgi:glycosyltransferase involved in cell wall biosynthesis